MVLNFANEDLGVTPISYFTDVLKEHVLPHFKINTDLDILWNFYVASIKMEEKRPIICSELF